MSSEILGSVVLPAASILISTGFALYLARNERKAAFRARVDEQVERLATALSDLTIAAHLDDRVAVRAALTHLFAIGNVMLLVIPHRDRVVVDFIVGTISHASATGEIGAVERASQYGLECLEAWRIGAVSAKRFQADFPESFKASLKPAPDLTKWDKTNPD
jgi:hypothetical protein